MKINVNIPMNSKRTRILSAFMAFLIFALTFQQAFVGWDIGLRVRAEAGDGNIRATSTNKTSSMKSNIQTRANTAAGGTSPYTYSGQYTDKNKITLFDYVSDYELFDGYNNCLAFEEGYVDSYTEFNSAISGMNIDSSSSNNVTFVYKKRKTATSPDEHVMADSPYVYLWNSSSGNHLKGWKDKSLEMTWNNSFHGYTLTFDCSSWTDTYDRIIICGEGFQTDDITLNPGISSSSRGTSYTFSYERFDGQINGNPKLVVSGPVLGTALNRYSSAGTCSYTNPLYFGCFWRSNTATAGYDASDGNKWNDGYDSSNKASYNNFFWQANMGLKTILGTNSDESENHFNQRGSASTQGLIYSGLAGGARGNIKDTDETTELPYFNKNSSLVSSGLMKYYDHDGTKGDIVFPFYEVTTTTGTSYTVKDQSNPSTTTTYSNLQIKNGDNLTGGSLASGEKARFYQFNSKDANLKFVIEGNDPSNHSGYFQESNNDIYRDNNVGANRKNVGFFPFNNSDTADKGSTNTHNLGFGTKFEMDFQLEDDGCVSAVTVDQNGNVNDANSGTRIHSVFEFEGDDDLWIFIDGQLVLDMGGAHYKSHGIIDFASRTVTVDKAITLGADNGTSKDNLAATVRTPLDTGEDCTRKSFTLSSDSYDGNNKYTKRNHTMTIFYMERGMLDSNLLIRFNYAPTPNLSRMKIAEATRFDGVNPGLLSYTQRAAEDDIFQYTVKNNGTNTQDVKDNTAVYPKGVSSVRTNEGDSTITTQLQQGSSTAGSNSANFDPHDSGSITNNDWQSGGEQPVHDTSYLWVDKFAAQPKLTGKTNSNGQLYLMYGTDIAVYDPDDDTESSAEFEKQFSKNSIMKVIQGEKVYSPTRTANTTYNLFGGANNEVFQPLINNSRSVEDYYTTTYKLVDRNSTEIPLTNYGLARNHADYGTFTFSNATTTDQYQAVMLTEYFINTVNTGTISVTKNVTNEASNTDVFEFTLSLSDVFGVSGVSVGSNEYGSIEISGAATNSTGTGSAATLTSEGKFYIKGNGTVTISGIPVGTKYTITESTHTNYTTSTSPSSENQTIANGTLDTSGSSTVYVPSTQSYTITNTRRIGNLVLNKTVVNKTTPAEYVFEVTLNAPTGVSLSGITLDNVALSTQPTSGTPFTVTVPVSGTTGQVTLGGIPYGTTYTVTEANGSKPTGDGAGFTGEVTTAQTIDGVDDSVTITNTFPEVHEYPVTVTKTGVTGDDMSGAEFELWYKETVPPQTNSFNEPQIAPSPLNSNKVTATPAEVGVPGVEVVESVTTKTITTSYNDPSSLPESDDEDWILPRNDTDYIYFRDYNDKSATGAAYGEWDEGSFNSSDKYAWRSTTFIHHPDHNQELELSYDESKWFAAEFSGNDKKTVRYAVWERFVDAYSGKTTVIWKIQPPDGYTDVRFMLLKGDTVIRKTEKFKYELGKIYHKTNWGGYWTSKDGQNCYYDVPVTEESANNDGYWAPEGTASTINDKRMSASPYTDSAEITYTRQMLQARKYEPTEQKIVFHCNSSNVWHNIHIQFFTDSTGTPVNGQAFPGYMMEPFAYAGNDYRMSDGYLTYELTIPANATHFRVNNGVESGTYAYKSAITALKTAATDAGSKNYGNYWKIGTENYPTVTLTQWTPTNEENGAITAIPSKTYSTSEVTSDYDYVYFKNTGNWSKVYAYFYAGGDLRGDNWQRATYSSWPGVAPAGTEYGTTYSTTYGYPVTDNKYNGTTNSGGVISPEATVTINGSTVYKFRIPKGDRKNYSKVIFNDGLSSQGGGNETGVIDYEAGHVYDKDGRSEKHYENSPTTPYTARTNSSLSGDDKTEYIYVLNSTASDIWDDLHITFYDANGTQILQQGKGYIMDYAGNNYYRIPLPADAVKFSVNNGMGTANASKVTPTIDIVRLTATSGVPKTEANKAGTDRFVYQLTNSTDPKLTRTGFSTNVSTTTTRPTQQEEGFAGYPTTTVNGKTVVQVRNHGTSPNIVEHTLNIRDTEPWNVAIGSISVTFYNANGESLGTNVMLKTVADAQGKKWYTKKIHPNAASFTVTYNDGTSTYQTPRYPIYAQAATAPADGSNYTQSGSMFYDTVGTGADSALVMTHEEPVLSSNAEKDETYSKRGDYLYLIYTAKPTDPTVTFYASGTNVIKSGIKAKYINLKTENGNTEYWYKVSIPEGAQSFWATDMTSGTKAAIYELRAKYSPYRKDYTLGDMQYKISGSSATLVYPVFTPDTINTLDVSTGQQITSQTYILVDESQVSGYSGAAATLPTPSGSSQPSNEVLYNTVTTDQDNITYSWTEGTEDTNIYFEMPSDWSGTPKIYLYNSSSHENTTWDNSPSMTQVGTTNVYKYDNTANWRYVVFRDGSHQYPPNGTNWDLSGYNYGKGKIFKTVTASSDTSNKFLWGYPNYSNNNWLGRVYFWNGSGAVGTAWPGSSIEGYTGIHSNAGTSNTSVLREITIPSGATYVSIIYQVDVNGTKYYYRTTDWPISDLPKIADGNGVYPSLPSTYYTSSSDNQWSNVGNSYKLGTRNSFSYNTIYYNPTSSTTWVIEDYSGGGTQTTLTYSYQPEDRYGMISDQNTPTGSVGVLGKNDVNNFITLVLPNTITTPYIKFYDESSNYINAATGSTASTKGLLLKPDNSGGSGSNNMKLNDTGYTCETATTNTYKVRLPKNAKSFEILNGTTSEFTQELEESGVTTVITGTDPDTNAPISQTVTIPGTFRHAGTTFTYDSTSVTSTPRSGLTPFKQTTMTDPLEPMSDNDFIYFTDPTGTFDDNGGTNTDKVFAYFYGGADGEYKAWPGMMATTTNSAAVAATTYMNNSGQTVYKFRVPKDSDGSYPYVIFSNGQATANLKITAAQTVIGGRNYTLGSALTSQDYGTMTDANKVFGVTTNNKAPAATINYNTSANKTIYFINNGTYTFGLTNSVDPEISDGRYVLDDIRPGLYPRKSGSQCLPYHCSEQCAVFPHKQRQRQGNRQRTQP